MAGIFDFLTDGQQQPQQGGDGLFGGINSFLGGGQPQEEGGDTLNPFSRFARNFGQIDIDPTTGALKVVGGRTVEEEAEKKRIQQAKQFREKLAKIAEQDKESARRFGITSSRAERRFQFEKEKAKRDRQRDEDVALAYTFLPGFGGGGGAASNVVQPVAPLQQQQPQQFNVDPTFQQLIGGGGTS